MDSISNVISVRAENLFKSPTIKEDPTIDLEAPFSAINNEQLIPRYDSGSRPSVGTINKDDILFQEEVSINLPEKIPTRHASSQDVAGGPITPEGNKIAVLKSMIKSMQNQLDAMLQLIGRDTK